MDDLAAASARLDRLDGYLRQDPRNAILLADACDTAIACGEHQRAEGYLQAAEQLATGRPEWSFRRARLAIARRDLATAIALLQGLLAQGSGHPACVHDLAYVHLLTGDFAACRSLVEPWVRVEAPVVAERESLQVLWLRALHRLGELDAAWSWANAQDSAGTLERAAKGVASLIALDLGDFESARSFADAALQGDREQLEALVTRGCVALACGEVAQATTMLQSALRHNPEDGRVWSALGMASLYAQDLVQAQEQLERALATMADHIGSWHALGWVRLLRGDRPGARSAFEGALALDRNFAESHGAVGLSLALDGDPVRARQHLDAADRLDARNITARYARALLAGELSDVQHLHSLLHRLMDRPGFFGGKLRDALPARFQVRH